LGEILAICFFRKKDIAICFFRKKDIATKYSLFKTFSTQKMLVPMSIGLYNIKQRNIKLIVNNIKNSKLRRRTQANISKVETLSPRHWRQRKDKRIEGE
jgi:hypothetical protein